MLKSSIVITTTHFVHIAFPDTYTTHTPQHCILTSFIALMSAHACTRRAASSRFLDRHANINGVSPKICKPINNKSFLYDGLIGVECIYIHTYIHVCMYVHIYMYVCINCNVCDAWMSSIDHESCLCDEFMSVECKGMYATPEGHESIISRVCVMNSWAWNVKECMRRLKVMN